MESLVLFGSFIVLLLLSVPIGYAIGISAMLGLIYSDIPLATISNYCIVGTDSFALMAIPLFVMAGNLMANGGIARRLLDVANAFLGYIRGGLAIVTTLTCMFFAAVSGSAVATTTAMGTFMIPAMTDKGYDKPFAGSVCAAAGSIGVIIPPSIPFVLFGCVAQVSIADLFIAGIIPGLLMGLVLSIVCYIYCRVKGYSGSGVLPSVKGILKSMGSAIWALLMPVIILGGIYSGAVTPTESAGIAVIYCLFVDMFIYREIKIKELVEAMKSTIGIGCVALYLMGFSQVFGTYLTIAQIPSTLTSFITGHDFSPFVLLLVINVFSVIYRIVY